VTPQGTFEAVLTKVIPSSIEPVAIAERMQIKGVLSGLLLAEAGFDITNLGVTVNPSAAKPGRKVLYHFGGFTPGKPIWGHYLRHGRQLFAHRFGKASGPCGTLTARATLFPGHRGRGTYRVQFDTVKRYRPSTSPKALINVTLFRF